VILNKRYIIFGLIFFLFLFVFFFVFFNLGFQNYIKAQKIISSFPKTETSKISVNNFNGDFYGVITKNTYGGVLVMKSKYVIAVFGESGLKFFYPSGEVVYRIGDGCLAAKNNGNDKSGIGLTFFTKNFSEWVEKIQSGDNIVIISKTPVLKLFNEIDYMAYSFNWWFFLKFDPDKLCKN
jgi:hypothetical protein